MTSKKRILTVDDSDFIRRIVKSVLTKIGFEVKEAASGEAALDLLQKDASFDLAILDINMPGIDGLVLAKKIIEELKITDIQICMLSTESDKAYLQRAFDLGIKHWLLKPFKPEELTTKVQELLGEL